MDDGVAADIGGSDAADWLSDAVDQLLRVMRFRLPHWVSHVGTRRDMRNGDTKWISEKSFGKYVSMVTNGNEILALDEDGTLYLIEASPEKLIIKEEREISADPSWAHLAISGKQLFVRELEAIACYEW